MATTLRSLLHSISVRTLFLPSLLPPPILQAHLDQNFLLLLMFCSPLLMTSSHGRYHNSSSEKSNILLFTHFHCLQSSSEYLSSRLATYSILLPPPPNPCFYSQNFHSFFGSAMKLSMIWTDYMSEFPAICCVKVPQGDRQA